MPLAGPALDYAKLAQGHLRLVVSNALKMHGLDTDVYHAVQASDSDYLREVIEEDQYGAVPDDITQVLVGDAALVGGTTTLDDIIAIEDKLDADVLVTTLYEFRNRDKIVVRFSDDKYLSLKIISAHDVHGLFSLSWVFHARVM